MSFIPTDTLNMSLFSLDTGFDSTPGIYDPVYNPRIVEGTEIAKFFTRQVHFNGRYVDGIVVDANGITLPQGYVYILDPILFYSGGGTSNTRVMNHFRYEIEGIDIANPKWASHYATDVVVSNGETIASRGYKGFKYIDCSLTSKNVKIKAWGDWAGLGNVYFDVEHNNTSITVTHKSHILIHAIPSDDLTNQTVRTLDASQTLINGWLQSVDCIFPSTVSQLPADALNKYVVCTRTVAGSYTYYTPLNPTKGDWIGFIMTGNVATANFTLTCQSPAQTLVAAGTGTQMETCFMWQWTGSRWVQIPFSSQGLVKLPRA